MDYRLAAFERRNKSIINNKQNRDRNRQTDGHVAGVRGYNAVLVYRLTYYCHCAGKNKISNR